MSQSLDQFEEAFEREQAIQVQRKVELRKRASNRSRARQIVKTEKRGRVRFGVLFIALTVTVVVVVVVMFETLAWLVGG
jgi:t-SNARE complex subunit (syntaxin)